MSYTKNLRVRVGGLCIDFVDKKYETCDSREISILVRSQIKGYGYYVAERDIEFHKGKEYKRELGEYVKELGFRGNYILSTIEELEDFIKNVGGRSNSKVFLNEVVRCQQHLPSPIVPSDDVVRSEDESSSVLNFTADDVSNMKRIELQKLAASLGYPGSSAVANNASLKEFLLGKILDSPQT